MLPIIGQQCQTLFDDDQIVRTTNIARNPEAKMVPLSTHQHPRSFQRDVTALKNELVAYSPAIPLLIKFSPTRPHFPGASFLAFNATK